MKFELNSIKNSPLDLEYILELKEKFSKKEIIEVLEQGLQIKIEKWNQQLILAEKNLRLNYEVIEKSLKKYKNYLSVLKNRGFNAYLKKLEY